MMLHPAILACMSNEFIARAIALATENVNSGKGGPFGAVIVKDRSVIAEGVNSVTLTNDPTAHAELLAIRRACAKLATFELRGCDVYCSCEPCPMCLGAIYWVRPARVYFAATAADASEAGFDDSLIYRELSLPYMNRKIPMARIENGNALGPFRAWEQQPNKQQY
jgi:guanine deaminase